MGKRLAIGLLMAAGVFARAEVTLYDGVAAYVNDKVITVETVMMQMRMNFDLARVPAQDRAAKIRELFPVMRDMLVDRLLILKAYEDSGAQLPNEAVNGRVKDIVAESFEGNEAKLRVMLRARRMTYEEWVKQVREDMIVQAMRQLQIGKKVSVSPKVVKTYFAEHMDDFAEEGGVRVRTIMIVPEKGEAAAKAALEELAAGAEFGEVARKYSGDEQAANGGDWGFVQPQEVFSPQMVEALAELKEGAYREVSLGGGYRVILQKAEVRRGRRPTLAEAWPRVERVVKDKLGRERYEAWLEELRKHAYIYLPEIEL